MTEQRKNEIWAMLPSDLKELVTKTYKAGVPYDAFKYEMRAPEYHRQAEGGLYMLEFLFGKHNLTTQADETTQKSPLDVAESAETSTKEDACIANKECDEIPFGKRVVTPFGEGIVGMDINGEKCVKLDAGGCAGLDKAVLISETENTIDYAQYRLDLAKEIAVAMIKSECDWDVSNCAVSYANEIVKRLKETEE